MEGKQIDIFGGSLYIEMSCEGTDKWLLARPMDPPKALGIGLKAVASSVHVKVNVEIFSLSMEYTPLGVYNKPTVSRRSLALTGRSEKDVETYLRHMGILVVFLGHEEFGFANLHLVEPHLMEWYEVDLVEAAQFCNSGAAPLRSMRKFRLRRFEPMVKGKE